MDVEGKVARWEGGRDGEGKLKVEIGKNVIDFEYLRNRKEYMDMRTK